MPLMIVIDSYSTTGARAGMGDEDLFRLRWLNASYLFC